jgi:hypothetical protein
MRPEEIHDKVLQLAESFLGRLLIATHRNVTNCNIWRHRGQEIFEKKPRVSRKLRGTPALP